MSSGERRTARMLVGLAACLCLVATSCGNETDAPPSNDDGGTETTIDMNEDVHTDPDMDMDDE